MKVLFVFGAGASCDADEIAKNPPLGNKLFDELVNFDSHHWGNIKPHVAEVFKSDFEMGSQCLTIDQKTEIVELHKSMARYFFGFEPSTSNLYSTLIKRIKNSNSSNFFGFSTLNYERFLELTMMMNEVSYPISYPHGCCHLIRPGVFIYANEINLGDFAPNVICGGAVVPVHDSQYFCQYLEQKAPPVMSVFEPRKNPVLGGGDFLESQRQLFRNQCETADIIIVIGIQYREHDTHVWDSLARTNGKVVYCSGYSAIKGFVEWQKKQKKKIKRKIFKGYFRDEFEKICKIAGV